MARLLPADFDLSSIEPSERRVCESFIAGLDDTWFVLPQVRIADPADPEIDLLLVSPTNGAVVVEVKGGVVGVRDGAWYTYDRRLAKSPVDQAIRAKHALVKRLRSLKIDLHDIFLVHAIALPDVGSVPTDGFGVEATANMVFAKPQLEHPENQIHRLTEVHPPVPTERLLGFLGAVRPNIELSVGDAGVMEVAARRLDSATRQYLASARSADRNRRVLVTGGAGTGKTYLVMDWARRAIERGERTLVVCFNRPIAQQIQHSLKAAPDDDVDPNRPTLMVGSFHDVAVRLLEPFGFRVGVNPNAEYWVHVVPEAMSFHAQNVGRPFDTIIVDEGQDFYPHWFERLEALLDPTGPRRLLVCADPAQAIYVKPWVPPADMMELELPFNLRNARPVAQVVRRLGGPEPMPNSPGRIEVTHLQAGGAKEIRKRVRDAIRLIHGEHGVPLSEIAVLTTHTGVRDALITASREAPTDGVADWPLVRWDERNEEAALCETVHRAKGLERSAVVYVDDAAEPSATLLYIGASRAVSWLTLVGPPALATVAGIGTPGPA
jgi:hypothetical protein